ncbi:pairing 2 -like protein [Brachionus plicatilis]|uniref:Pairing 2-like protein n=1 Tax=Brachionus plicatilis TaxID=10195 RepID=A0A3M7QDH4_BRAPC|nr:pairing 2 -like protein [Brachionus plicatilis]
MVLEYLVKQNRPFSAQDVTTNLNIDLGKSSIANILEKLAVDNRIIEKTYGKQKIYMALQSIDTKNIKTNLRDLDEKIVVSKSELNRIVQENLSMEAKLKSHGDQVPVKELEKRIEDIQIEIKDLEQRLSNLKSKNTKVITKEERNKADKDLEKYSKKLRSLRRIGKEMIETILENSNVKKKDLIEDLCIVLD